MNQAENQAFEKWAASMNTGGTNFGMLKIDGLYADTRTSLAWAAWQAARESLPNDLAAERERCAKLCEAIAAERFENHGVTDWDTGTTYYRGRDEDEYDLRDEEDRVCAASIRAMKPSALSKATA